MANPYEKPRWHRDNLTEIPMTHTTCRYPDDLLKAAAEQGLKLEMTRARYLRRALAEQVKRDKNGQNS